MIKANELRINNWVGTLTGYAQCIDVLCDSVNTKHHEGIPLDMLEPIPLTIEILESADFEKEGYYWGDYYSNKHLQLMKNKTGEGYLLLNGEDVVYWNKVYLYVHELQNLHFILTGEELDIKL